jgi:hypothetical protein
MLYAFTQQKHITCMALLLSNTSIYTADDPN